MADLVQYRSSPDEGLDCLYIATAEKEDSLKRLDLPAEDKKAIGKAADSLGVRGIEGEMLVAASPIKGFQRVACFGIGRAAEFNLHTLRRVLRRVLEQAGRNREYQIAVALPYVPIDTEPAQARSSALAELALCDYRFDRFRSRPDEATKVDGVHVVRLADENEEGLSQLLDRARRMDVLVRLARDLGNRPANDLTPTRFAAEVTEMFRGSSVRVTAMGPKELEKDGLQGILAVGRGSAEEPRLVRMEYRAKKPRAAVAMIGKGVTFDAGGISGRTPWDLAETKHSMAGAAAVVAAMKAVAEDQPPLKAVGLVPLVENLPSGTALKPGDILTLCNGTTVEVDSTGFEGRVLVADAMAYAGRFNSNVIIDLATLTGACSTALGHELAGLFSNDDELAALLEELGRRTGDRVWRMPLLAEYRQLLRSQWADLRNGAGRCGSLPASAAFLEAFVPEGVSWAHLDIAGVAHLPQQHNGLPAGATGFGVRLLLAFLEELAGKS
jgi:leucyl aminopeptidase